MKRLMTSEAEKNQRHEQFLLAADNARKILKPGDRLRVTKCPGTRRWITFAGWDGKWIVSKSGKNDYAAICVDRLNKNVVDFTKPASTNGVVEP